ncbi:kinase-like domain-containing protein [Suillus subalutaceus]|uniref:kinase-like domain-containing protein n=1 Tax=Suillus subalutaceus TaxID=48586 RepID=UPI001B863189|nr:kinase-like domain-containing protein [Suillus subalutaceus]KAG1836737.1 kinase-like domain-containing protein [Suillus subalutaceus]
MHILVFSTGVSPKNHFASNLSSLPPLLPISIPTPPSPISIPSPPIPPSPTLPSVSSLIEDVLSPGDLGEPVRPCVLAPIDMNTAKEFEVVRRLGTGSYAVVYRVREVISRTPISDDGHVGVLDLDPSPPPIVYGRHFALKVLSKANLDSDALTAQLTEVTIHQSLSPHPNIVTLHRTLETDAFLLLVLEFVPGEDLFYFLEQARDHYAPDESAESKTPPTPSLLATLHPSALLSHTRLRLIASMFAQMCDAVAACHDQRKNFIVTDGYARSSSSDIMERKVLVKLTDFGLSTNEVESADMDCGSAPYMSFECRNNVAPTYSPERSDVWSLGIVLINMLYHYNPWTDTSDGTCSSFSLFRAHGAHFFMQRFTGMTWPVAEFLTQRVFVLPPFDANHIPVTAREFGAWIKDLPALLCDREPSHRGHKRVLSTASSTVGHPLSSCPPSRRPSSRAALRTPLVCSRSLSRAPSVGGVLVEEPEDLSRERQDEHNEDDGRSRSTKKRGKRGSRKAGQKTTTDETLQTLAVASQSLAREISLASRGASRSSLGIVDLDRNASHTSSVTRPAAETEAPRPVVVKKPSKWKLGFGSGKTIISTPTPTEEAPTTGTASNVTNLIMGLSQPAPNPSNGPKPSPYISHGSINVNSSASVNGSGVHTPLTRQRSPADEAGTWARGRRPGSSTFSTAFSTTAPSIIGNGNSNVNGNANGSVRGHSPPGSVRSSNWRSSMSSASTSTSTFTRYSNSSVRSVSTTATSVSSGSWRNGAQAAAQVPKNVKIMNGVPWELDELPRQLHPNPVGDIFGQPPQRKARTRKSKLDTISERPAPVRDAATSTTDLGGVGGEEETPKKVQKGQINALAKMLSALRR